MQRRIRFSIPPDFDGSTLVAFLARRFPYHTAVVWGEKAAAGRVMVNDAPAPPGRPLRTGDIVLYVASDVPEPPVPLQAPIVHEDADLLIVNKPAGLPTHPGGSYHHHTLWAVLKRLHDMPSPAFVNRLDRETSGLVVVAKTPEAAVKCRAQFAGRRVEKRYLAVVEGRFPPALDATGRLVADPAMPAVNKRLFLPAPRPEGAAPPDDSEWAETGFRLVRACGELSLVEVTPRTGRQHQIRATLHALGFPLVGDKLYGRDPGIFLRFCQDAMTDEDRRALRLPRQALHAVSLKFRHPRNGFAVQFEAPLPADMAALARPAVCGAFAIEVTGTRSE